MKKGEVWTASTGGQGYTGKPRPVIIMQDKAIDDYESVILCLITSSCDGPYRIRIEPSASNGLRTVSWAMPEKLIAISKSI